MATIIDDIENELALVYQGGAICYIDENYDDAWSKAMQRFDQALSKSLETKNWEISRAEGLIYRDTVIRLIAIYKTRKRGNKVDQFFNSLGGKDKNGNVEDTREANNDPTPIRHEQREGVSQANQESPRITEATQAELGGILAGPPRRKDDWWGG